MKTIKKENVILRINDEDLGLYEAEGYKVLEEKKVEVKTETKKEKSAKAGK